MWGGGYVYDSEGISEERLAWVKELKNVRRGRISEYAKEFGCEFHAGERPWKVPCDLAFPSATQNEEAALLVKNGCLGVSEGANMPTELAGVHIFKKAKIAYAPAKAANAGGVAVSGLEMSQNSAKITWKEDELQKLLRDTMEGIHTRCVEYGDVAGSDHIDYVKGANLAGFVKVADAMLAYGVV